MIMSLKIVNTSVIVPVQKDFTNLHVNRHFAILYPFSRFLDRYIG